METVIILSPELKKTIKKGAGWLDTYDPEWITKIKLNSLDMAEGGQCILGQSQGNYWDIICDKQESWPAKHGFNCTEEAAYGDDSGAEEYELLRLGWVDLIKERRKKAKAVKKAAKEALQ